MNVFTIECCLVRARIWFSVWLCTRICTTFDCHCHAATRRGSQCCVFWPAN